MSIENHAASPAESSVAADLPSAPSRGSTPIALVGLLLLVVLIATNMNC